ncbi:hypothetical protein PN441_05420 [Spirulina major CS-329]|nr:hypothetical protein [Spirulina subsalsa]MDB9493336.1 hypothetical protein [Spirulina subsalsa CS-330]MDB9502505.1 hypothetical protein [Spirulina major CS-329]
MKLGVGGIANGEGVYGLRRALVDDYARPYFWAAFTPSGDWRSL